jgi:hypothetical protein
MTEPLSTQALAWLRQRALVMGSTYSRVLLHLLERVEALEKRPIPGAVELATPHQPTMNQPVIRHNPVHLPYWPNVIATSEKGCLGRLRWINSEPSEQLWGRAWWSSH